MADKDELYCEVRGRKFAIGKAPTEIVKALAEHYQIFADSEVHAGYVGSSEGRNDGGENNASIAYKMEYGSPEDHVPARPFLGDVMQQEKGVVLQIIQDGLANSTEKDDPKVGEITLKKVGTDLVNRAQNNIRSQNGNTWPPLSDRTIRERYEHHNMKAPGILEDSDREKWKPLQDTGQLLKAIHYEIVKKGH